MADLIATIRNIGIAPLIGTGIVILGLVAAFTQGGTNGKGGKGNDKSSKRRHDNDGGET